MGGTIVAGVSVASSAMQQILCRFYLKKHAVSSHDLLSATAPLQVRPSSYSCPRGLLVRPCLLCTQQLALEGTRSFTACD